MFENAFESRPKRRLPGMRRRRRRRLLRHFVPVLEVGVLLVLGAMSAIGLIYWPEYYLVDLSVPIALIILFVTLRWL